MNLPNKLETGKEVAFFPPVQNTQTPYTTLAAMYAEQESQVRGYLYFVTAIGYYEYLGTVNGTAVDYRIVTAVRPYKVYTALIYQSWTNAPVATVLENTLGGTVVWSVSSVGVYHGTLTAAFTWNKTLSFISGAQQADIGFGIDSLSSVNYVRITTRYQGSLNDNQLNNASIEIRVYN